MTKWVNFLTGEQATCEEQKRLDHDFYKLRTCRVFCICCGHNKEFHKQSKCSFTISESADPEAAKKAEREGWESVPSFFISGESYYFCPCETFMGNKKTKNEK